MKNNEMPQTRISGSDITSAPSGQIPVSGTKCPGCGRLIPITQQQLSYVTVSICPHCHRCVNIR